jgi:hypothetical protein
MVELIFSGWDALKYSRHDVCGSEDDESPGM